MDNHFGIGRAVAGWAMRAGMAREAALRRTARTGDVVRMLRVAMGCTVWVGYTSTAPGGSFASKVHCVIWGIAWT